MGKSRARGLEGEVLAQKTKTIKNGAVKSWVAISQRFQDFGDDGGGFLAGESGARKGKSRGRFDVSGPVILIDGEPRP